MNMEVDLATAVFGTTWDWLSWGLAGLVVGALAGHRKDDKLGAGRNLVIGVLGGLLGGYAGLVVTWFRIGVQGSLWSFLAASIGAIALLSVARRFTGGRSTDKRTRTP